MADIKWIPITEDCSLPDDRQEVLITTKNGDVEFDTFFRDADDCFFACYDVEEVIAWMSLPKPYKAKSEE